MSAQSSTRTRGTRAARRQRTQQLGVGTALRQAPAYITRKIPWYAFVEDDALEAIERQTDKLLHEVGVEFRDDPAALERWRKAGADVIRS